ncbi:fumarylacetoacetate hydrolase [Hyphomonas adhaerens MHS-3]|uniref:Fumarylacetoacetate hydrolase n=1 Tax=Hyphomonas adhaerens MHS-3 TaxID=1280949 RepID=A0A069E7Q5_9PROT|nr:fumarylacetoacetate hydrolase family protein [Hyphomonas adhaerens]KCZ86092.1 fumarylacetoacetate hydrolase [Hyphomonas adhaerens MHS-3]
MKLATINNCTHLITEAGGVDIARASGGRFSADMKPLLAQLSDLRAWADDADFVFDPSLAEARLLEDLSVLEAPISNPDQLFAIGLNYRAHSEETGLDVPDEPMVFTKFASSIGKPSADVVLPTLTCDWEVELVAVIGKGGRNIPEAEALEHIAGYCVGQDVSERTLQFANTPAQFSLAKSYPNFAPIGPWITTTDEVSVDQLKIGCHHQTATLQDGNTAQMIFSVAALVSYLSKVCELRTGDLIFTGTPEGVGLGDKPPRYIEPGWVIESEIEGLGRMSNRFEVAS